MTTFDSATRRACLAFACAAVVLAWAGQAHGQAEPQRTGGGIHPVAGIFVGRYDPDGASPLELLGGRLGLGFGELAQVSGFYWRGVSRAGDGQDEGASLLDDSSWGGELQFNLNTGFGVTPYIVGGVARVTARDTIGRYAATTGAGLSLPLGRVLFHVAARDHMFGVTGLRRDDEPDELVHNWLYSAGITLAFGSRRSRPGALVAAAPQPPPDASPAAFELRQLRDSLAIARGLDPRAADAPWPDSLVVRSYQSSERLLVPIPTQGSITLRYGPEPSSPAMVVTPAVPGLPAADPSSAAPGAGVQPTEQWLRQFVAAEVAQQLAARPAGATQLTRNEVDAITQRVLDGVVAAVVPRLDAAQAQRMNTLREDLRAALTNQRAEIAADLARYAAAGAVPAVAATPPALAAPPATPPPLPPAAQAPPAQPEGLPVEVARPPADPAAPDASSRSLVEARSALARSAALHGALLSAAETERGPAAVLGDGAFDSGSALLRDEARSAVAAIAAVLREYPGHRVYVQGHTDAVGTELDNQRLSELRAEAVRALLVLEGLPSDRVFAIGYGQGRPVAPNESARGRGLNRRVEVVLGEYAPVTQ